MTQETLEEAAILAWDLYEHTEGHLYSTTFKNAFKLGANWKAERTYSEEEAEMIARDAYEMGRKNILIGVFNKWFKQLTNKKTKL